VTAGLETVPRAPGALPLIGHVWPLWRDTLAFVKSLRQHGELVRVDVGGMPIYFATSAAHAHAVMVTNGTSFEKGRLFDRMRPLVGAGLATADSRTHRRHRRLMQPSFHRERIADYCAVISGQARTLTDSWQPGQQVAVEEVMGEFSVSTLAATMFSADIGRDAVDAVRRDVPVILKNMLLRAVSPQFLDHLPIPPNRRFDAAAANLRRVIDEVVAATRRAGDAEGHDLLSTLLAARDADTGEALTDTEVRDELVTILFAGTETVASTLSWAFHEIARHPEVEKRLLAEIDSVVTDGAVGFEEVARTEIAFSLYAVHQDPALYPEPGRFDPDRWLPENREGMPREAFVPFGSGSRQCIGDAFARAEMTITLATVLSRWRLRPVPGHTPKDVVAAMPHPDHVPMTVTAREAPESA
jgi:cytochrome P450